MVKAVFSNVPHLRDIVTTEALLRTLGAEVTVATAIYLEVNGRNG